MTGTQVFLTLNELMCVQNTGIKVKIEVSYLCARVKTYTGKGGITPLILKIDNKWQGVVKFKPRSLYVQ